MSYLLKDVYGMYKCNIEGGICFLGAKTLIGEEVIGKNGKKLGEIQELMIDMKNQKVAYALMSFAGFLGMGERLFAVPFGALRNDGVKDSYIWMSTKKNSIPRHTLTLMTGQTWLIKTGFMKFMHSTASNLT